MCVCVCVCVCVMGFPSILMNVGQSTTLDYLHKRFINSGKGLCRTSNTL